MGWKEMFASVHSSDSIEELGVPPGIDEDADFDFDFEEQQSLDDQVGAAVAGELSVWAKTKLAWQLGIAEVVNMSDIGSVGFMSDLTRLSPLSSTRGRSDSETDSDSSSASEPGNSISDCREDKLREVVISFYEKHNPSKLKNVNRIVSRYVGNEKKLVV